MENTAFFGIVCNFMSAVDDLVPFKRSIKTVFLLPC